MLYYVVRLLDFCHLFIIFVDLFCVNVCVTITYGRFTVMSACTKQYKQRPNSMLSVLSHNLKDRKSHDVEVCGTFAEQGHISAV